MFVPILIMIAAPIAARNSKGSIQDVVDSIKISMMMGSRMINALIPLFQLHP